MNRSRVIIAAGIVVLILIGLFVWLGGDDTSEPPVAEQQQTAAEKAQTAQSDPETGMSETAGSDTAGADAGGSEVASGISDPAGNGSPAAPAEPAAANAEEPRPSAEAETAAADTAAADTAAMADGKGRVARDRTQDDAATQDRSLPGRATAARSRDGSQAPASDDPAGSGQVAVVTGAPDAGSSAKAADEPGRGATAGMASGEVTERRPAEKDPMDRQTAESAPGVSTTADGTAGEGNAADSGPVGDGPGGDRSDRPDRETADAESQASSGQQQVAALADPREGPTSKGAASGDTASRDTASGDTVSDDTASREDAAPRSDGDAGARAGADRTPDRTAALERQTRTGTQDSDAGEAGRFPLPSFDIVRISQDCRAVIAGRAMPRALVVVSLGEDRLGEVMADRRGEWVLIPDQPLRPGPGEMRLSATPQDGQPMAGNEGVIVSVPDCGKGDGTGREIIAVRTDDRDSRPSRILQLPGQAGPDGDLRLDTVDYDEAGKLILSGRAEPSTRVNIYANNAPVGQVRTDDAGRWSLLVDDKVPVGPQTLRLDQVGDRGVVKSRVEFPFSRASFRDLDLGARNVIVQPGNSLWRIARRVYGEGLRYTVIYQANTEQIRDPDLIYPGQIFNLPEGAQGTDRG